MLRPTVSGMIPTDWTEHHRAEDGELLGYLAPGEDGTFWPVTVFGHPLGGDGTREDAERTLDAIGLSYLADQWLLERPGHQPISVQIVEASPDSVTVANVDYGTTLDYGHQFTLTSPVDTSTLNRG